MPSQDKEEDKLKVSAELLKNVMPVAASAAANVWNDMSQ